MKLSTSTLLFFISYLTIAQNYGGFTISSNSEAGVYSDQMFIGKLPFNNEVDMMKVGNLYVIGKDDLFAEISEKQLKTGGNITLKPGEIDPKLFAEVSFSGLEKEETVAIAGFGINLADLTEMSNQALSRYAELNELFSNDENVKLNLSGMRVSLKEYDGSSIFRGNNVATLVKIKWTLKNSVNGETIFEKTIAGGHYLGKVRYKDLEENINDKNYAAKMATVSSLKALLGLDEFKKSLSEESKTENTHLSKLTISQLENGCSTIEECIDASISVIAGKNLGSGFIISSKGYILTNEHVVEEIDHPKIQFSNGMIVSGEVIRSDKINDVALVKVEVEGLPYFRISPNRPEIGETVMAIGTPKSLSLGSSLTKGVVSGYRPGDVDRIQTDLSINRGNSGGPLFNEDMEVLGIVSSKIERDNTEGINFSIFINDALKAINIE